MNSDPEVKSCPAEARVKKAKTPSDEETITAAAMLLADAAGRYAHAGDWQTVERYARQLLRLAVQAQRDEDPNARTRPLKPGEKAD